MSGTLEYVVRSPFYSFPLPFVMTLEQMGKENVRVKGIATREMTTREGERLFLARKTNKRKVKKGNKGRTGKDARLRQRFSSVLCTAKRLLMRP